MYKETFQQYREFVTRQKDEKQFVMENTMTKILTDLTETMRELGWIKKGKGSVTQNMVDTHIMKFDFVKTFGTETVTLTISTNLGDDYLYSDGYNQISIKGSKPIPDPSWWKGGTGSHFHYFCGVNDNPKFSLESQVKVVNQIYNG